MNIASSDLDFILQELTTELAPLKNAKIFLSGGTGFIGKWLLEAILFASEKKHLNISVTVLTRNKQVFTDKYPHFKLSNYVNYIEGDVRYFKFPDYDYDYVIHAATEASARMNIGEPLTMADVIVNGTRHILDFAVHCEAKKVLFLSSGAVYGKQPDDLKAFSEEYTGAPDPLEPGSAYGVSKRMAELLCASYSRRHNISCSIARCFAFVGPYLSLDTHYAIGNFINDGIKKRDIIISGDGKPLRSYMYAADLVIWLLKILLKGNKGEAYNVGSEVAISIKDLADKIAEFFPGIKVQVLNQLKSTDRNQNYIPDVQKAIGQFSFQNRVSLDEAIFRTIQFYRNT